MAASRPGTKPRRPNGRSCALAPRSAIPDGLKQAARLARRQGWEIYVTSKAHLKWVSPDGRFVITGQTISYPSSVRNSQADLRRKGLQGI